LKALSATEVVALQAASDKNKEFKEALEVYEEFKRLRKQIGKPVRSIVDPKKVRKDLTGEDFFSLLEEVQKRKH
jgi:hypothetical protein